MREYSTKRGWERDSPVQLVVAMVAPMVTCSAVQSVVQKVDSRAEKMDDELVARLAACSADWTVASLAVR